MASEVAAYINVVAGVFYKREELSSRSVWSFTILVVAVSIELDCERDLPVPKLPRKATIAMQDVDPATALAALHTMCMQWPSQ
jgi:hypothetical protein